MDETGGGVGGVTAEVIGVGAAGNAVGGGSLHEDAIKPRQTTPAVRLINVNSWHMRSPNEVRIRLLL
jgi:hypothetical protein